MFYIKGLILLILPFFFCFTFAQRPETDFYGIKGIFLIHLFDEQEDTISSLEILELKREDGLPEWYARDFVKVVCLDTLCRLAKLRLFWNINGDYLRFEVPDGEPLTKLDHVPFTKSDYDRLDQILKDSLSILRDLEEKDLVIKEADVKTTNDKVDGYTGATTPSLSEYTIKGAAYTCYTLWHTVHGTTSKKIRQIETEKVSRNYISRLFGCEDDLYSSHAIGLLKAHPEYDSIFIKKIVNQIKSTNDPVSKQALNYFTKEQLVDPDIQKQLIQIFREISYQRKFELLWKLADIPSIHDDAILSLLQLFEDQQINATLLGYVCKLIHSDNLEDPRIVKKLKVLSKDKNLYVRNMMKKLLLQ